MKLYKVLASVLFASTISAGSADAVSSVDLSSLMQQWSAIAPTITKSVSLDNVVPTRLGNVDPIPTSLMLALFTGVPQSVIVQLVNPTERASIASAFAAGETPSWYAALPTPVQSYIASIHAAIKTGGTPYTGTEAAPSIPGGTAQPGTLALTTTGGAAGGNGAQGGATSTKHKGAAVAVQTWGAMELAGLGGVVGVLGLAVGL